jgi:hypothetical protein
MRSVVALGFALGMALSTVGAQAGPFPATPVVGESMIVHVAYGCGPGRTRGPYGHCRPRFTCPRGWHPGPRGFHCFRNR